MASGVEWSLSLLKSGDPDFAPLRLQCFTCLLFVTDHFPDAFAGSNTKIRDTLNNLLMRTPQNWQTTVGLPFVKIEGTVVEWDEIKFDVRLLQRVPVRCR